MPLDSYKRHDGGENLPKRQLLKARIGNKAGFAGKGMLRLGGDTTAGSWHHVNFEDFPRWLLWLLVGGGDAEGFAC